MIDLTQITPLHENDIVVVGYDEYDGDVRVETVNVYIGTRNGFASSSDAIVTVQILENGKTKCMCSECLPVRDWEGHAECYERALRYAKMARFLSRDV